MLQWIRRNWKWTAPMGAIGLATGLWLAFGWFGLHTLFTDTTVDEAAPVFASQTTTAPTTTSALGTTTSVPGDQTETETTAPTTTPPTTTTMPSGPVLLSEGTFVDRSHPTSGMAVVLGDGTGERILRLEDFRTDNGPDLFVYLSRAPADSPAGDLGADFVDLGVLKGNVGSQNYEIPADVDLDTYSTVVIWCRRFAVAFGAADLEV